MQRLRMGLSMEDILEKLAQPPDGMKAIRTPALLLLRKHGSADHIGVCVCVPFSLRARDSTA